MSSINKLCKGFSIPVHYFHFAEEELGDVGRVPRKKVVGINWNSIIIIIVIIIIILVMLF